MSTINSLKDPILSVICSLNELESSIVDLTTEVRSDSASLYKKKDAVIEKAKKVEQLLANTQLDLTQITVYDAEKLKDITDKLEERCNQELQDFRKAPETALSTNDQIELRSSVMDQWQAMLSICDDIKNFIDEVRKSDEYRKREKSTADDILTNGLCRGFAISVMQDSSKQPTDQTMSEARYIQAAYLVDLNLHARDTRGIGQFVITPTKTLSPYHQAIRNYLLQAAAKRMGFSTWADLEKSSIPAHVREDIVGKIAAGKHREFEKKIQTLHTKLISVEGLNDSELREYSELQFTLRYYELFVNAVPDQRLDYAGKVPETILKKRGLKQKKKVIDRELFPIFTKKFEKAADTKGEYILSLHGVDHSLYVSFKPYRFCDNNDQCIYTGKPKIREFGSKEEFLEFLLQYLSENYPDLPAASLFSFEKTINESHPPRPKDDTAAKSPESPMPVVVDEKLIVSKKLS